MNALGLSDIVSKLPVISGLAGLFYILVFTCLLFPQFRRWLDCQLTMPKPTNQSKIDGLDALRGLAALFIACFHAWQWNQPFFDINSQAFPPLAEGTKAVPIFVVLSGFLIWRATKKISSQADLHRYARNRFLRVAPLYIATIFVATLFGLMSNDVLPPQRFVAELFFLPSIGFPNFSNPPTWSLYPEILFYIMVPIFAASFPAKGNLQWLVPALAFLILSITDYEAPRQFGLAKYFAMGILVSEIQTLWSERTSHLLAALSFALGCFLLYLELLNINWSKSIVEGLSPFILVAHRESSHTVGLAIAVALIMFGICNNRFLNNFFSLRPLRWLGAISFGVFMWHSFILLSDFPLKFSAAGTVKLSASFGGTAPWWTLPGIVIPAFLFVGIASFILIERPFLLRK